MAVFDQRPKQFTSYGYPGSKFIQNIELQGFGAGAVLTFLLWSYNQNDVPNQEVKGALQPEKIVIDAENYQLVLNSAKTADLTDPRYWLEYRVDDVVHGGSQLIITRDLGVGSEATLVGEYIQLTAGVNSKIVVRNPDTETVKIFNFREVAAVNGQAVEHNVGSDLTQFFAFTSAGVPILDFNVVPVKDDATKKP